MCRSAVFALWIPFNQHGFGGACAAAGEKGRYLPSSQSNQRVMRWGRAFAVPGQTRIHRSPCLRSCAFRNLHSQTQIQFTTVLARLCCDTRRTCIANSLQVQNISAPVETGALMFVVELIRSVTAQHPRCGRSPCRASPGTSGDTPRPSRRSLPEPLWSRSALRNGPLP